MAGKNTRIAGEFTIYASANTFPCLRTTQLTPERHQVSSLTGAARVGREDYGFDIHRSKYVPSGPVLITLLTNSLDVASAEDGVAITTDDVEDCDIDFFATEEVHRLATEDTHHLDVVLEDDMASTGHHQLTAKSPTEPLSECPETSEPRHTALSASLRLFYHEYVQSITQLQDLPLATSVPASDVTGSSLMMSKTQSLLAKEEGTFWGAILQGTSPQLDPAVFTDLRSMMEKSSLLSVNYNRTANPPTTQTYADSKAILAALGVPCIESSGPYEAEALASAIVLSGLADYVASEDTVRQPFIRTHEANSDIVPAGCSRL